jgi:sphinganine-1-phosphate aldolase
MSESVESIFADLDALGRGDLRWKDGRAFSLAYYAGPEVQRVSDEAVRLYGSANGLNADAFPSLRRFQSEVVETVRGWLGADESAAGFMTSGGTESILLAVKAARQQARADRGVRSPNVVLPTSAHAAFEKAGHYFDVETRRVEVRGDWRADVAAMADVIDDQTVLVVGSAPQYPQGVIDPIAELSALALSRGVNFHVDACMGGVTLAFMERAGEPVPAWNFSLPGVTSMSVDLHKYGYSAKGASVIMYRDKRRRSFQTFMTDNWLGGLYGSSGILGTKSGGPFASAWAVIKFLGSDGYLDLTRRARRTTIQLAAAVEATPGLVLRAAPDSTLLAFGADLDSASGAPLFDINAVADLLWVDGWYVDRQGPPPSLHCTVNAVHESTVEEFVHSLRAAVSRVLDSGATGEIGAYGTVD